MKNKILLVDGNSIMNRGFYGLGGSGMLSTKDGVFTNAIFGFLNIIDKFIALEEPTHLCVAFDLKDKTFRHLKYKEYKAGRKKMSDELAMQFPIIKEILDIMNIARIELSGFEADDLIGSMKTKFEEKDFDIVMLTGDKDYIQLASDKTTIKIPTTKAKKPITNTYTYDSVMEDFNITPDQFKDVKALMGDKSDNIPGVAGVGEKTALGLIVKYNDLANLYENIEEITKVKLKEKLINDKDNAFLSYELGKIDCTIKIDKDVEYFKIEEYDKSVLYSKFTELEFNYFINKYKLNEVNKKNIDFNIVEITDKNELVKSPLLYIHMTEEEFIYTVNGKTVFKFTDFSFIKEIISKDTLIVGHYLKKILIYFFKNNIPIPKILLDTATCEYVVDSTKSEYILDDIFNKYTDVMINNEECSAPVKLFYIKDKLLSIIKENDMDFLLNTIELPLIEVLAYMEYIGFQADAEFLNEFSIELASKIEVIEKEIHLLSGVEFNIASPKQLGKVLFEDLQIPHGKKNKTGYSTSVSVLERLKDDYYVVDLVLQFRKLSKLRSTYAVGLLKVIEDDGRIHSNFNQTVAATGRISSTEPNMQNIPIRSELGKQIRKALISISDDYFLVSADYSQIELRVLAHISKDKNLLEAYNNNLDIHTMTASQVFGIDERMVTSDLRRKAKAVNFGIVYGISDFGLARDLHVPVKEAKLYIEQYLKKYELVKKYMDDSVEYATINGYVSTIYNRKRIINEIKSKNYMQREFGKRIAMNSPIQGSAADIIKLAMNNVYKYINDNNLKSRLVLQIHDELVIETHKDEVEIVYSMLTTCMKDAFDLDVPLDIDINKGRSLFETK